MYRNIKYAFKIDFGTLENLLPLAISHLFAFHPFPKDNMKTVQRIAKNTVVLKNRNRYYKSKFIYQRREKKKED